MRTDNFDPYTIGECIAAQTIKLAYCIRDHQPTDPATAGIVRNIAVAAQNALVAGGKCLQEGEVEAALWALGAADGAMSLIVGLMATPDDAFMQEMARPFAPAESELPQ